MANSLRRTILAMGCVVIATVSGSTELSAGFVPAKALMKVRPVNSSKTETADDYHIKINDPAGALNINKIDKGPFTSETHTGNGTGTVTVDFFGGKVPPGGFPLNGIGIEFIQKDNLSRVTESYYTETDIDGNHVKIGDAPLKGFKVDGDPIYTVFNDMDVSIGIRDLQFLVNVDEIPFESLNPGNLSSFGTLTAALSDFVLAAHSSLDINVAGTLDPGRFLYAQGTTYDATFTTQESVFLDGHQSAVPEPSTLVLIATGGLVIGIYGARKFRVRGRDQTPISA